MYTIYKYIFSKKNFSMVYPFVDKIGFIGKKVKKNLCNSK